MRPKSVRVRVEFAGPAREWAGMAEREVELRDGACVGDVMTALRASGLGDARWLVCAAALNDAYAQADAVLRDGDVVAVLPPVSGGGQP